MLKYFFFLLSFCLATNTYATQNIIIDHDGGVDDFVALTIMACDPNTKIDAITIAPADSYKETAFTVSKRVADYLHLKDVNISASDLIGTNPFPDMWRADSDKMANLPILSNVKKISSNKELKTDAPKHLVKLLSGDKKYIILETGPFSNIAAALELEPKIKNNIKRIYAMGGAFRVKGNVEENGHDNSAEWNIYNNPKAALTVLNSGIPITFVPLDATQSVPVNMKFINRLKGQHSDASKLVYAIYQVINDFIIREDYYFWDTLTAAILTDPSIVKTETSNITIIQEGKSQGRTLEIANGVEVDFVSKVDKARLENLILNSLESCNYPR